MIPDVVRSPLPEPPRHVTVVDDDDALRGSLKFTLETVGLKVAAFRDAESALAAIDRDCDCLVLDQRLPGLSGLDLLEQLRRQGQTAPTILITTNPGAKLTDRARRANVEIMEKPLLGDSLTARVLELVNAH